MTPLIREKVKEGVKYKDIQMIMTECIKWTVFREHLKQYCRKQQTIRKQVIEPEELTDKKAVFCNDGTYLRGSNEISDDINNAVKTIFYKYGGLNYRIREILMAFHNELDLINIVIRSRETFKR